MTAKAIVELININEGLIRFLLNPTQLGSFREGTQYVMKVFDQRELLVLTFNNEMWSA